MATLYSYALTTLEDVKESLDIASSDTSKDNLIIRKINAATDAIEKFTGRRFKLTTYTNEEYDATNTDQLILKQRPVTALSSMSSRDTSLNEDDWTTSDTELYFLDAEAGVIDLNFVATGRWNRYRVTYTAGYTDIPADLAEAAAALASFLVSTPTNGSAVKSKEEGQRRIEYFDSQAKSSSIFDQLGILGVLQAYANDPILADK